MNFRNITFSAAGLIAIVAATTLFTGCSMENPADNFKIIVEGEVEKTLFDSTSYSATGKDSVYLTNYTFHGRPESVVHEGVTTPLGADAAMVGVVQINTGNNLSVASVSALVAQYRDAYARADIGSLFKCSIENTGDNPIRVTVYACGERGLDTAIVRKPEFRVVNFIVGAHSTLSVPGDGSWRANGTNFLNYAQVLSIVGSMATTRRGVMYVHVNGDPTIDAKLLQFRVLTAPYIEIYKRISPNDLRDYDLQALNSIGMKGTVAADSATANFYVRFTNTGPVDSCQYGAFNTTGVDNPVDLQALGNGIYIDGGLDFLKSRFTALFPVGETPGRPLDFYITFLGRKSTMTVDFRNLGVVANARIEQH